MSKQATLSVVPTSDRAEAMLSPSRQRLVQAYERRKDTTAAFEKATMEFQRVEGLIADTKPIEDRIAELEAENAAFIEKWALSGGGAAPKPPYTTEIDRLKAELHQAEIVAKGAKKALQHMHEELQAAQADSTRSVEGIRSAGDMVLVDEIAREYAEMLSPLEERAALLRAALKALQTHLQFEGARGRPLGNLANTVGTMIPRCPDPAANSIEKLVGKWAALASRLFTDQNAAMEL